MRRHLLVWLLGLLCTVSVAADPPGAPEQPLYYVAGEPTTLYHQPDSSRPYVQLALCEPVHLLGSRQGWQRVRTRDGAEGYVKAGTLSNVWIRVVKRKQRVYVYRGPDLIGKMPADFSNNLFADKSRRGGRLMPDHWRTPEGHFFVVDKNADSRFYRALVLNYPTAEDAHRGLREGLISREEHEAIVQADEARTRPPMNTALGGLIEIHGDGTGRGARWTRGCVAVRNAHMDRLWRWVRVGTPVLIE